MKFDRNTLMGFGILAVLFIGYFYFTNKQQNEYRKQQAVKEAAEKARRDSIALLEKPKQDSINRRQDSIARATKTTIFTTFGTGFASPCVRPR